MALAGWISLIIIVYTSTIYPLLVFFLARSKHQTPTANTKFQPCVSVIVPIHNAEMHIENKLANLRSMNYPKEKLEIIFVSDGSTDSSVAKLSTQEEIRLVVSHERVGKEQAIKMAMAHAKYDILCLTDIATEVNANGLQALVNHMASPDVGASSSVDGIDKASYSLEKLLLAYENQLRISESKTCSSTGLSGSFFVTRRKVLESIPHHCASDFAVALECVRNGLKSVVEQKAIGYYRKSTGLNAEYRRKTRTVIHGLNTIIRYVDLLNFSRYGIFSWQLISHKLFRWCVPLSLLVQCTTWVVMFEIHGHLEFKHWVLILATLLMFHKNIFLLLAYNVAITVAVYKVALGVHEDIWEPTKRKSHG